jgi:CheY-like chemotaxis protein
MSSKRALVVDDSKSARAFLARILERHEITVDAAESAEAALDYLTRNRPDVIFMDHLMPGMDGFQAVQTIKNNPRTSSIPILMYTSQEGDLYLGQARALGAEGVLPKQIKQSDVTRMLFQLQLVSDRRERARDQTTFTALENSPDLVPANESAIIVEQPAPDAGPAAVPPPQWSDLLPALSLEIRAAFDASLQKELAALRSYLGGRLDSQSERLQGDLAALLPGPRTPETHSEPLIPERRASTYVGWTLAFMGFAATGVMSWMWWTRGGEIAALNTDLTAAYAELEDLRARPVATPATDAALVSPTVSDALDPATAPAAFDPTALGPTALDATARDGATPDPSAVVPAPDAPDALATPVPGVDLVPTGAVLKPHAEGVAAPAVSPPRENGTPAGPAPSQQAQ